MAAEPIMGLKRRPKAGYRTPAATDSQNVIKECPEQVHADIAYNRLAQIYGSRHVDEGILHKDHIRRIDGNIRSCTDSDSHIRPGECGASLIPSPTIATLCPFS